MNTGPEGEVPSGIQVERVRRTASPSASVDLPVGFRVFENSELLKLRYGSRAASCVLTAIWLLFIAPCIAVGIGAIGALFDAVAVFLPLGAALGVASVILPWRYRIELVVEHGSLSVSPRPIPFGTLRLSRGDVAQLYVQGQVASPEMPKQVYQLLARTRAGKVVTLVSGIATLEQGRFLEAAVERHLGIDDEAVEAEVSKKKKATALSRS